MNVVLSFSSMDGFSSFVLPLEWDCSYKIMRASYEVGEWKGMEVLSFCQGFGYVTGRNGNKVSHIEMMHISWSSN